MPGYEISRLTDLSQSDAEEYTCSTVGSRKICTFCLTVNKISHV